MISYNGHRIIRKGSFLDRLIRYLPRCISYYHQVRIGQDCSNYFQFSWRMPLSEILTIQLQFQACNHYPKQRRLIVIWFKGKHLITIPLWLTLAR